MTISVSSAVGAGFNVIGRRPLSVVAWGFFSYFAVLALFALGILIVGLPALMQVVKGGVPSSPDQVGQMALGMFLALWPALLLVLIGSLFIAAIVQGAAIRSILHPDQKAFASLRFGREEGALLLLFLLYVPVIWVVAGASLAFALVAALVGRAIHGFGGGFVAFLLCLMYGAALMWVSLRFSLAAPMTFAERRVRFLGSWSLTRGQGWALFGLAWLMVLVWIGVFIAYGIVSGIVNAVSFGGALAGVIATSHAATDPSQGLAAMMAAWPVLALAYIPVLLLQAAFQGIVQAIGQGPWADVYRQLAGSPDVATTFN